MNRAKSLLLASVAIAIVGGPPAFAAPSSSRPILLAQATGEVPDTVKAAEAKVAAARAALEQAMANGQGIKEARQELQAALKELDDARKAAGLPPVDQAPAAAGAPPDNAQPPTVGEAPAAGDQQPPSDTANAPTEVQPTPPPGEGTDVKRKLGKKPPDANAPTTTTTEAPQTDNQPAEALAPPTDQTPPDANALKRKIGKKPPDANAPTTTTEAPKTDNQPAEALAPTTEQAPTAAAGSQPATNPPPPAMANGQPLKFDPSFLKRPHPRFGEVPKTEPNVQLPKLEAQIPTGGEIDAGAGRIIVKEDNGQVRIQHDDTARFRQLGGNATVQQGPNGTTTTTIARPGGVQIVTIQDRDGNILQRYRKDANGQIQVLIGLAGPQGGNRQPPPPPKPTPNVGFDVRIQLPPIRLNIPRDQYVVESSRASRALITQTFEAPPVEQVERPYSLEEIRRSERIREKVRRIDFDTVTFEFGSAVLPDDQIPQMQAVGEAIKGILQRSPDQVFLIEGHTDAVGSDLANLALSDRRAETVAEILTYYFGVPPENLVSQGYGEQYLKVPTNGPERQNRRVAFRNITSLMRVGNR